MIFDKIKDFIQTSEKYVYKTIPWLILSLVVTTFLVVVLRYVFNLGWVWLQESLNYMHSIVFLMGASYALYKNAHVRVDIFQSHLPSKARYLVDIVGTLFFLFPTCLLIIYQCFPYVIDSWKTLEVSTDNGIPAVFLLKSLLLVFPLTLMLQGFVQILNLREGIKQNHG